MRFRITRAATRDLEDIGDWIARDDPDAAARFVADLTDAARRVANAPFLYPIVGGPREVRLRKRSYRSYIILYRVDATTVSILRVLRHSRDYASLIRNI